MAERFPGVATNGKGGLLKPPVVAPTPKPPPEPRPLEVRFPAFTGRAFTMRVVNGPDLSEEIEARVTEIRQRADAQVADLANLDTIRQVDALEAGATEAAETLARAEAVIEASSVDIGSALLQGESTSPILQRREDCERERVEALAILNAAEGRLIGAREDKHLAISQRLAGIVETTWAELDAQLAEAYDAMLADLTPYVRTIRSLQLAKERVNWIRRGDDPQSEIARAAKRLNGQAPKVDPPAEGDGQATAEKPKTATKKRKKASPQPARESE